jgi:hypothetical protein
VHATANDRQQPYEAFDAALFGPGNQRIVERMGVTRAPPNIMGFWQPLYVDAFNVARLLRKYSPKVWWSCLENLPRELDSFVHAAWRAKLDPVFFIDARPCSNDGLEGWRKQCAEEILTGQKRMPQVRVGSMMWDQLARCYDCAN